MRRLRAVDALLLATLVPLWGVSLGLAAKSAWVGVPFSSVYVSAPVRPSDFPQVTGFRPWLDTSGTGLAVGDRLLSVGDADLRGVGPLGLWIRVTAQPASQGSISVGYERAGVPAETRLPVGFHSAFWTYLVVSLAFGLAGVVVLLRARASPAARALALVLLAGAVSYASNFGGSRPEATASLVLHLGSIAVLAPLALRAVLFFPDGRLPDRRLLRAAPWAGLVLGVFEASQMHGTPLAPELGFLGFGVVAGAIFAALIALGARAWRRADPVQRRQIKWFLLGLYLAALPNVLTGLLVGGDAARLPLYIASQLALALVPLFLLVALSRYNFLDVDRILSATASYNLAVFGLAVVGLVGVPRVAEGASRLIGIAEPTSRVLLSLGLASVLVPVARRLRPWLDRRFFVERHALDRGMEALLSELSGLSEPRELIRTAGMRLHGLLRPESCVVYALNGVDYEPLFVEGRGVPPVFEGRSPLVATLRRRREPVALSSRGRRRDEVPLAPFDRAALATLAADVVVPVHRSDTLVGFLCLGTKRSGDVYTPVDLTLLAMIAEKVSSELLRFDTDQLAEESRAMREALRRYVPGAVAEQLERGGAPDVGEREVSVMFVELGVDLSQPGSQSELFSRVNRATEAASAVVRRHGGSVVEFNGEVLMAVFGAPAPLPDKERAAVEAACALQDDPLAMGAESGAVGIATGSTFVGSIRSADRVIWSAIGDTTNLAARLQGLAGTLEARVVVDGPTHDRAGSAAEPFEARADVTIRGRSRHEDLWVLPRGLRPAVPAAASGLA